MNKSSKAITNDRKARYAWRPTGVANVYMRGTKYYYVKMNRGKRHFVPLADSPSRPVLDLAEAIRVIPMSEEATEFFKRYLPKLPSGKRYLLHPEKVEGGANRYRDRVDFQYSPSKALRLCPLPEG